MLNGCKSKLKNLILLCLTFIGVTFLYAGVAYADKPPSKIVFDSTATPINVVSFYKSTPETQKDIVSSTLKASKSFYKSNPGFGSYLVLQSEDGTRVLTLTQWKDQASYEAFAAQATASESAPYKSDKAESYKSSSKSYGKKSDYEKEAIAPDRTIVYQIDKTQAAEGVIPGIYGLQTLIQFSDVVANDSETAPTVVASIEETFENAVKTVPAPHAAILLKGLENGELAMLANWGYSKDELSDPEKLPDIDLTPEAVDELTTSDENLYEVVKVVTPKLPKEKYGS